MELEQRVKTLEYEFKILKNEVQRTLLDIQEQILVHYYPALRTEEAGPSDGITAVVENLRKANPAPAPKPAAPAAAPVITDAAPTSAPASAASVKQVSLDEIRQAKSAAPDMNKLTDWIATSAAKIGGERTSRVLQAVTAKGALAGETLAALAQTPALKEAGPEKVPSTDVLSMVLRLDGALGREANVEEALTLIEEAKLG